MEQRDVDDTAEAEFHDAISLLTFRIADNRFAVNTSDIAEVVEFPSLCPLPFTSRNILGLMNLRGHPLPVYDLRKDLSEAKPHNPPCFVLIADFDADNRIGLAVDSLEEMTSVRHSIIQPNSGLSKVRSAMYIRGVYAQDDDFTFIFDLSAWYRNLDLLLDKGVA